jgi:hypothetical protein
MEQVHLVFLLDPRNLFHLRYDRGLVPGLLCQVIGFALARPALRDRARARRYKIQR